MMLRIKIGFIFMAICCIGYLSAQEAYLPFSSKPFNNTTPVPINIDTNRVENIITKPLTLLMGLEEKVVLQNIGTAVEAILASPFTSTIVLGGGVAYDGIYVFNRQKYFFANRTGAFTGTTIDGGNGAQLETALIYTNIKYGPLQEAMKYRDGVFEIVTLIRVGECAPNEEFEEFAKYLKYISEPGSSIEMPIVPTWQFYNHFPTNQQYYAMPGAYVNDTTGEQIYCSTLLIIPVTPNVCITKKQFDETFGLIKDQNGRQSDTSIQLYPAGDRPVVSTEGIVKITVPLNMVPSVGGYDNSTASYIGGYDNSTAPYFIGGYDNSTVSSIGAHDNSTVPSIGGYDSSE